MKFQVSVCMKPLSQSHLVQFGRVLNHKGTGIPDIPKLCYLTVFPIRSGANRSASLLLCQIQIQSDNWKGLAQPHLCDS